MRRYIKHLEAMRDVRANAALSSLADCVRRCSMRFQRAQHIWELIAAVKWLICGFEHVSERDVNVLGCTG
jgi:hypothetical protein